MGKDESIRKIQSNRFEIFVKDAADKGSRYFDKMIRQERERKRKRKRKQSGRWNVFTHDTKERLIRYAVKQARRDPRIAEKKMDFQNFSLICSFGKAAAQHAHVDMLKPNYQFLLCLTDQSPATYFYDLEEADSIKSVHDLRKLWETEGGTFPSNLAGLIEKSEDASMLLEKFGDVFHPHAFFQQKERKYGTVPVGTVLSLPGGVVHAGPQTEAFRAVLFFTAAPEDQKDVRYNPDAQFNNIVLTGLFILVLWRTIGITRPDRLFLLRRLASYIQDAGIKEEWEDHFRSEKELFALMRKIRTMKTAQGQDKILDKTATEDDFVFYHVQSADLKGDFTLVSEDNLWVKYIDNKTYPARIYKREEDGRVLLQYTSEPVTNAGDGFEGICAHDFYTLNMHTGQSNEKFNGTNGTLLETDGSEIECSIQVANRQGASEDGPPKKKRCLHAPNDDWEFLLKKYRREHSQNPDKTWFTQFENFWRSELSKGTFQKIMLQVGKLSDGTGVGYQHWPSNIFFHKDKAVDLSTDFEELLRQAKEYEHKYGTDIGKGWLLRIPISKLIIFQEQYFKRLHGLLSRSDGVTSDTPLATNPGQSKTDVVDSQRPKYAIGTRFVKAFPNYGVFIGRIESFDGSHYKIFYPKDEDEEELTQQDLDNLTIFSE
uniref:Uncharacterized protein n=1 Tax=Amphora coffeiformis TaxID=265554 RepID=A0A7S3KY91_9STRA